MPSSSTNLPTTSSSTKQEVFKLQVKTFSLEGNAVTRVRGFWIEAKRYKHRQRENCLNTELPCPNKLAQALENLKPSQVVNPVFEYLVLLKQFLTNQSLCSSPKCGHNYFRNRPVQFETVLLFYGFIFCLYPNSARL